MQIAYNIDDKCNKKADGHFLNTGLVRHSLLLLFVLVVGPISTADMKAYCTLTPQWSSVIHLQMALHTKRRERPLLAKDGTKAKEF
jgi:hypothetical protein